MSNWRLLLLTLLGCAAIGALASLARRILVNTTPSVPIGFYVTSRPSDLRLGELVAVDPSVVPPSLRRRGYLRDGVLLLKPIAATPGQHVCVRGDRVEIDHRSVGPVLSFDSSGRPLAPFPICRNLRPGELFVAASGYDRSFDSRYFGPIPASSVLAKARPLWTF